MTHKDSNGKNVNYKENSDHDANSKDIKMKNKWMNPKARGCCAYAPTIFEHYANIFTHAVI